MCAFYSRQACCFAGICCLISVRTCACCWINVMTAKLPGVCTALMEQLTSVHHHYPQHCRTITITITVVTVTLTLTPHPSSPGPGPGPCAHPGPDHQHCCHHHHHHSDTVQGGNREHQSVDKYARLLKVDLHTGPQVERADLEICRLPNGELWVLGSGACGTVYKVSVPQICKLVPLPMNNTGNSLVHGHW